MSQEVTQERIDEFKQDRKLLPYDDTAIADKMEENRGNFSSYMNGRRTITNKFLERFYQKFGQEIKKIKEKLDRTLKDAADIEYMKLTLPEDIAELNQKYDTLANNYRELTQHYNALATTNLRLEQRLDILNQKIGDFEQLKKEVNEMRNSVSLLLTRLLNRKSNIQPKKSAKKTGKQSAARARPKKKPGG